MIFGTCLHVFQFEFTNQTETVWLVTEMVTNVFSFCERCSLHYATVGGIYLSTCRVSRFFWEELSRLIWRDHLIRRPLLCCVIFQIFFDSFPSRVKVSYFPFLNCFASFLSYIILLPELPSRTVFSLLFQLDLREKISSAIQNCFSHASH